MEYRPKKHDKPQINLPAAESAAEYVIFFLSGAERCGGIKMKKTNIHKLVFAAVLVAVAVAGSLVSFPIGASK